MGTQDSMTHSTQRLKEVADPCPEEPESSAVSPEINKDLDHLQN